MTITLEGRERLDTITYRGYRVDLWADDDLGNPLTEIDEQPTLALHDHAERHFGWSTDKEWGRRLQAALDAIAQRGVTKRLYGPGGALDIVNRWLRVCHSIPVVLHVGAMEHSGTMVYLGSGSIDPGGFDSGWIGWLFATQDQFDRWGVTDEARTGCLAQSFDQFAAWVSGDCYGYTVTDDEGQTMDSCGGFYGIGCFEPGGWARREVELLIDDDIADREKT